MHFGDIEVRFLDAACSAWTAVPCSASSPRCSGKRSLPRTTKTASACARIPCLCERTEKTSSWKRETAQSGIRNYAGFIPFRTAIPSSIRSAAAVSLPAKSIWSSIRIFTSITVAATPASRAISPCLRSPVRRTSCRVANSDMPGNPPSATARVTVSRIPGHNADIQAVTITGGEKTLAFVADLLPTRHHISLPWIMAYDLYPVQTLETKRNWLSRMVVDGAIVVFGHDPDIPVATLHQRGDQIEISPVDLNR